MFKRNIEVQLEEWQNKQSRKPLIIRGARQVGKTSVVEIFANKHFSNFVYLNLEKSDHIAVFKNMRALSELVTHIELLTNTRIIPGKTLLFIDEIQLSANAMNQLRYFYEELPALHVIAAGSMLEITMEKGGFSFPVGRVEYAYLYPASFDEFLNAIGENEVLSLLQNATLDTSLSEEIHKLILKKFILYIIVGGMPEIVWNYAENRSLAALDPLYESLLTGYSDDVFKYTKSPKTKYVQHIIDYAPQYCGKKITYENFGGSGFKSREISDSFDTLEKSLIVTRIPGSFSVSSPLNINFKRHPKLLFLDTGLANYKLGARSQLLDTTTISDVYKGQIAEQVVGNALLETHSHHSKTIAYWYRNKPGATSELDFVIPHNNGILPIEVKSGATGKLKSLFQFMEASEMTIAVRVYSGPLLVQTLETKTKKKFKLLSIPFYYLFRLKDLVNEL